MNNLDYLYDNLPTRFRRDDKDLFLKRFLQFFGETLDDYDLQFEEFSEQIDPETARIEFVVFWLQELFDWNWFPKWFIDADKRRIYGNMAQHLARRGTVRGIKEWLADFFIESQIHKSPVFYGEFCYGEPLPFVNEPLILIAEIGKIAPPNYREDICIFGESFYSESFYSEAEPLYQRRELENLLRFVQPHAQEIIILASELTDPLPPELILDYTAPEVVFINLHEELPLPGYYEGEITFEVIAIDNVAVDHIDVYIKDVLFDTIDGASGTITWDTAETSSTGMTDKISVKAIAVDISGNESEEFRVRVYIQNPPPVFTNFALASNGSTISASSQYNASFPVSSLIAGTRRSPNWGANNPSGGWNDGVGNYPSVPQTVEINFGTSRTITEIDVFSVPTSESNNSTPTLFETTNKGISDFKIEYWNGSSWADIQTITGNDKVWRQFTFAAITTTKIRVYITNVHATYARLTEIEAWGYD